MPLHVHGDEEEIFYVLSGRGIGYEEGLGAYPIAAGDVIVQQPDGTAHTRLADPGSELELLAFGSGSDTGSAYLPRAGVMWSDPRWIPLDAPHPWVAEGLAGPLERPAGARRAAAARGRARRRRAGPRRGPAGGLPPWPPPRALSGPASTTS